MRKQLPRAGHRVILGDIRALSEFFTVKMYKISDTVKPST